MINCGSNIPRLVVALHLLCSAVMALGPPKGALGSLDFRYPNSIVYPLVACPREGVFHHPRTSCWYYRCHDHYNVGYYWRSYYQCEPGTQFDDTLDQCVFPKSERECDDVGTCKEKLEQCRQERICPVTATLGTTFITSVEVCTVAMEVCGTRPSRQLCDADHVYDATNKRCIAADAVCKPIPDLPAAAVQCADKLIFCKDYQVCRQGAPQSLERLCRIDKYCVSRRQMVVLPGSCNHMQGKLFNVFTNNCSRIPYPSEICPGNPVKEITDDQCTKEWQSCQEYPDCTSRLPLQICDGYYYCNNQRRYRSCSVSGEVYAPSLRRCLPVAPLPREDVCERPPCGTPGNICVNTDLHTQNNVDDYIASYKCQVEGARPFAIGHSSLKCQNRYVCHPAGYKTVLQVCKRYFECTSTGVLKLKSCQNGHFYDYAGKWCTSAVSEKCYPVDKKKRP